MIRENLCKLSFVESKQMIENLIKLRNNHNNSPPSLARTHVHAMFMCVVKRKSQLRSFGIKKREAACNYLISNNLFDIYTLVKNGEWMNDIIEERSLR